MCSFVHVDDPNDAFWLAQTYFMTNQYSRAERLLTRPFPTAPPKPQSTPVPLTNGHPPHLFLSAKGKGREQDIPQPMPMPRLPMGPAAMIEVPEELQERVSRLVDMSVACRYLAAQCQVCWFRWLIDTANLIHVVFQVRQGNWAEATEMLGEANPFRNSGQFIHVR